MFNKRILFCLCLILFLILINITPAFAIDESKLIASAEKITKKWGETFSEVLLINKCDGFYIIKCTLVDSPIFDIKKTDSIISPYILIIKFKIKKWYNNFHENANATCSLFNGNYGFLTIEDALLNVKVNDFMSETQDTKYSITVVKDDILKKLIYRDLINGKIKDISDITVHYVYQKNNWFFKKAEGGGNFQHLIENKFNQKVFDSLLYDKQDYQNNFAVMSQANSIPASYEFTYDPEKHYLFWYKEKRGFSIDDDKYAVIDKTSGEVKFLNS